MVGRPDVAQKRTCAIADRRDLDRKSGRSKADGPILIWRRLLLSRTGASGVASRDGGAMGRVGRRSCRICAVVLRVRGWGVMARGEVTRHMIPRCRAYHHLRQDGAWGAVH